MMAYSQECNAMMQFLKDAGVPFTTTSVNTGTHANGSYHFRQGTGAIGLAIDVAGPHGGRDTAELAAIFDALKPVANQLAELIYAGPGIKQNVKHGKWVPIYDFADNTHTHVHLAVERGVFLKHLSATPPSIQEASHMINGDAVAVKLTSTGKGYWIVASDGGVFTEGDAPFHGSMGGKPLNKPIVGFDALKDDSGYILVGADGGIFTFGAAQFEGAPN